MIQVIDYFLNRYKAKEMSKVLQKIIDEHKVKIEGVGDMSEKELNKEIEYLQDIITIYDNTNTKVKEYIDSSYIIQINNFRLKYIIYSNILKSKKLKGE